jgi:hypothetical protein
MFLLVNETMWPRTCLDVKMKQYSLFAAIVIIIIIRPLHQPLFESGLGGLV